MVLRAPAAEVEKKTEELKVDSAAKEAELRACEAEREELSHIVAGQEAANIDAYRITAERARLMEELKRAATEKDRIQSIIYEAEIQLSNKQVDVERSVSEYHDLGRELKLMPSTAKYANGVDLEIPLQTRGNSIDQLVTLGGRTTLKHDLMALHTSLGARVREAVEDKIGHEESEREMAESVTEKRRDVRATEEECRSREAALAKEKVATLPQHNLQPPAAHRTQLNHATTWPCAEINERMRRWTAGSVRSQPLELSACTAMRFS